MSDFKTWFDKEYPLPEGYERGPIGRDFMNGCEKAYKAGKAELQAELTEKTTKYGKEIEHNIQLQAASTGAYNRGYIDGLKKGRSESRDAR